jgi:hypothetical protein
LPAARWVSLLPFTVFWLIRAFQVIARAAKVEVPTTVPALQAEGHD